MGYIKNLIANIATLDTTLLQLKNNLTGLLNTIPNGPVPKDSNGKIDPLLLPKLNLDEFDKVVNVDGSTTATLNIDKIDKTALNQLIDTRITQLGTTTTLPPVVVTPPVIPPVTTTNTTTITLGFANAAEANAAVIDTAPMKYGKAGVFLYSHDDGGLDFYTSIFPKLQSLTYTDGAIFNANGITSQRFSVNIPANNNGIGIAMWFRNRAANWTSGYLFDGRETLIPDTYQMEGGSDFTVAYAPGYNGKDGIPNNNLRYLNTNTWYRLFINIQHPSNAGLLGFLSRYSGNPEVLIDFEVHDLIVLNRLFTAEEITETGVPSTDIWARYLLDSTITGTVLDDTTNASHDGTLTGF